MKLQEILAHVPGLPRRFIYYLEAQGYIRPRKVPKQRIARRDYTEQDLAVIRGMWRYYQRGFSLQAAYGLATREATRAYVLFQAPVANWRPLLERLRRQPEVWAAAAIYATTADYVVEARVAQVEEIYQILLPVLAEAGITSSPVVLLAKEGFLRSRTTVGGPGAMQAYVLMKVPGKDVEAVMAQLRQFPEIVEASTVYGESDIIAKVSVPAQRNLDDLIMARVHSIPAVESTRTFIVVGDLHWSREGGA